MPGRLHWQFHAVKRYREIALPKGWGWDWQRMRTPWLRADTKVLVVRKGSWVEVTVSQVRQGDYLYSLPQRLGWSVQNIERAVPKLPEYLLETADGGSIALMQDPAWSPWIAGQFGPNRVHSSDEPGWEVRILSNSARFRYRRPDGKITYISTSSNPGGRWVGLHRRHDGGSAFERKYFSLQEACRGITLDGDHVPPMWTVEVEPDNEASWYDLAKWWAHAKPVKDVESAMPFILATEELRYAARQRPGKRNLTVAPVTKIAYQTGFHRWYQFGLLDGGFPVRKKSGRGGSCDISPCTGVIVANGFVLAGDVPEIWRANPAALTRQRPDQDLQPTIPEPTADEIRRAQEAAAWEASRKEYVARTQMEKEIVGVVGVDPQTVTSLAIRMLALPPEQQAKVRERLAGLGKVIGTLARSELQFVELLQEASPGPGLPVAVG